MSRLSYVDRKYGNAPLGIEIRMGVNYTEAVVGRGLSLEDYAAVTSTNAAKLLGLYPPQGRDRGGQRRRHYPHRPVDEKDSDHGRFAPAGP
jgi:hypothetical protein